MSTRLILRDLWSRHVPEKNSYEELNGRRVVYGRVFMRENVSVDVYITCYWCLAHGVVCRTHQFRLFGMRGIRDYVEDTLVQRRCAFSSTLSVKSFTCPLTGTMDDAIRSLWR